MGRMPPLVCLWPGLAQLWLRGSWSGLALAMGFAALVSFLLASTLVWTAWLSGGLLLAGWIVVLVLWSASSWGKTPVPVPTVDSPPPNINVKQHGPDLLAAVYTQYLQGNWFEAEVVLQQMLHNNSRDAEALLLLATLQRHTERLEEAAVTLDRLERLDEAVRWQMEIGEERNWLERLREEMEEQESSAEAEQPLPSAAEDQSAAA